MAVSVTTQDGSFSEPVVLVAEAIAEDSNAYEIAEKELSKIGHTYDGMIAFDIHFESKATGKEIEPEAPVDVELKITDAAKAGVPAEALGAVTVAHIFDNGGAEIVSEPEDVNGLKTGSSDEVSEFVTDVFSTFTITWTHYGPWGSSSDRTVTVHYGYMNGNSFTEFTNQPSPHDVTTNNNNAYLIYDFDGYVYSNNTYYRTNTTTGNPASGGTPMKPLLRYDRGDWQYVTAVSSGYSPYTSYVCDNNSHVYVVYKAKDAVTTGGTVVIDEPTDEDKPSEPDINKKSSPNGDGTNTLSLSVTGHENAVDSETHANVIVVLDTSGSMKRDITSEEERGDSDSRQRMYNAKQALYTLSETLLGKSDTSGNPLVKMALITFSTDAQVVEEFTGVKADFDSAVRDVSADGGTNWEKALYLANTRAVDSDAATFVIFVSDGDPTFRMSRDSVNDYDLVHTDEYSGYTELQDISNYYYANNYVFGNGSTDPKNRDYKFALTQAKAVKAANKNFYTIGMGPAVSQMSTLTAAVGYDVTGEDSHYFSATSTEDLKSAFAKIAESITTTLGWANLKMVDGITNMTNMTAKVSLQSVDTESFTYTRSGGKYGTGETWEDPAADGCGLATYNEKTGAVEWPMGSTFQLEDGVTYTVSFTVWPSQESYDLIADLNNKKVSYDSLEQGIKDQIEKNGGVYSLKTNTNEAYVQYQASTTVGDTTTPAGDLIKKYFPTVTPMKIDAEQIGLIKEWPQNQLDPDDVPTATYRDKDGVVHQADKITLTLKRGTDNYLDVTVGTPGWANEDVFISCGLMTIHDKNNNGTIEDDEVDIKEPGHEYSVVEPEGFSYYWDLIADVYRPMVINGTATILILDEDATTADNENSFKIDNKIYKKSDATTNTLKAENYRRSYLDLTKTLTTSGGNPDDLFTYTVTVTDSNSLDEKVWFSCYVPGTGLLKDDSWITSGNATAETNADGKTGYYYVDNGATLTLQIKAGWNVRFLNLYHGSKFSFEETAMSDSYRFDSITAKTANEFNDPEHNSDWYAIDEENKDLITGTITEPNNEYAVTYTNKVVGPFYVYHSSDNTIEKIFMTDERVTPDKDNNLVFNIVKETKTGTLYGGYYKSYEGASATDTQINETAEEGSLTYIDRWASDSEGTAYSYSYIKNQNRDVWGEDYYTVNGVVMKPEVGHVYYLKEVPAAYLLPYTHYTYNKSDKLIRNMWYLSSIDDLNYQKAGFFVETITADGRKEGIVVDTLKVTNLTGGASVTLSPKSVFGNKGGIGKGVQAGYLSYWDAKKADLIKADTISRFTPYWHTMDGVYVCGTSTRTVSFNNGKVGTNGMRIKDDPNTTSFLTID